MATINHELKNESKHYLRLAYKTAKMKRESILTLCPACDADKSENESPNSAIVSEDTYKALMSVKYNKSMLSPSISGKTVLRDSPTTSSVTHV